MAWWVGRTGTLGGVRDATGLQLSERQRISSPQGGRVMVACFSDGSG